ncbi:MAG: tetratricopeptide repeat protein [Hyphomicrobiales bacterium]
MSDESIFREVDEEIRHEQFKKLWDKYGIYVISACVGVVVAVGGIKGWQAYQVSVAESAGAQYIKAIEHLSKSESEEAQKVFSALASGGPSGYAALARFQTAAALIKSQDKAGAVKAFDALAADTGVDPMLRDLARVKAGLIAVDSETVDAVEARVSALNTRDNPWRNAAREIIALAAYRAGDVVKADRLYTEIIGDLSAPKGLRERAQIMLTLLQPQIPREPAQTRTDRE